MHHLLFEPIDFLIDRLLYWFVIDRLLHHRHTDRGVAGHRAVVEELVPWTVACFADAEAGKPAAVDARKRRPWMRGDTVRDTVDNLMADAQHNKALAQQQRQQKQTQETQEEGRQAGQQRGGAGGAASTAQSAVESEARDRFIPRTYHARL